ncbi:beta strand repeat-containing protein [Hymenobacter negativus]|uniref:T9SS type A sorting domain-containing protein n=1 Tax=Hymenobacter negativus TaxID=2795026 RepID=A0ABS3QP67_9BACT|nr:hypothetical protein [Hymenobacter negativus]MBO2012460.1 hypothetical protein [Hymenobacter negativus]
MIKPLLAELQALRPTTVRLIRLLIVMLLSQAGDAWAQLSGTKTIPGDYATLTAAVNAVNAQGIAGSVVLELQSNYSSAGETFPINYTLVPAGASTVTIRPAAGANGRSLASSTNSGAMIGIVGGKNLVIDGRPGGSGMPVTGATDPVNDLTIANNNTGLSSCAVAFTNDATFNTVQHCQLRAAPVGAAGGGVVVFGSTTPNVLGNSNNTVQYNDLRESSGGTPTVGIYSGTAKNAANTVANNNIYNFFRNSASDCYGIYLLSAGNGWVISGNSLYQTASRTGPGNANMYGMSVASGNNHVISGNFIGGQAAGCGTAGAPLLVNGTVSSYKFVGMLLGASSTTGYSVQGNTVANIDWLSNSAGTTSTGGLFSAIYVAGGSVDLGGTAAGGIGNNIGTPTLPIIVRPTTNSGGFVSGISTNGSNVTTVNLYRNTVQNITAIGSTTSVGALVRGIFIQNTSGAVATVSGNRIVNLASTVATNTAAICYGLDCQAPSSVITNNLIGDLRAPAANSNTNAVIGITLSTTSTANVYYNTVSLNASSTGTTFGNSALSASTAVVLDLRNNLLANNSTPGSTGLAVALRRSGAATTATYLETSNNNLLYAGTAAANRLLYSDGTAAVQTIGALKNLLTTAAGRDLYSVTDQPVFQYTTVTDAASQAGFLHLATGTPTQAESGAQPLASLTTDVDGDVRAGDFSDIGADEGTFAANDKTQPYIRFTALGNGPVTTSRALANVVVADPSGVGLDNSGPATAGPYIYYRKGTTGTFTQVAYTSVSGTGNTRSFGFTIDYSVLGGVVAGDVIQYYVAAQDALATPNGGTFAPNVGNILTNANPPGTTSSATYTALPNQYTVLPTIPGTVYVGVDPGIPGATFYASITKTGGLFSALNAGFLNQNVTAIVNANLSGEDGSNALGAFNTDGNGTTNTSYTLTIQSDGPARTVIGTGVATTNVGGLIRFNGALNVTVNGGTGPARNLLFRTTTTTAVPVFSFYNDARFNTLNNLTLESNNVAGSFGVNPGTVAFYSGASGTGGNRNNLIDNCDIRNRSDIATATGTNPAVAIYSGSSTGSNSNNSLRNSNVFDFQASGLYLASTGGGDNWTVGGSSAGNNFYLTTASTNNVSPVNINGGSGLAISYNNLYTTGNLSGGYTGISISTSGNGVVVANNTIGGSQAGAGGNPLTATGTALFAPISVLVGTGTVAAPYTLVQDNIIKNVAQINTGNSSVYGIYVLGGATNVSNNTIGDASPTSPAVGFNSASTTVGIYLGSSAAPSLVTGNTVAGFRLLGVTASNSFLSGISTQSGGHAIDGNTVSTLSISSGTGASPTVQGIVLSGTPAGVVQNNTVKGLQLASGTGTNGTLLGITTSLAAHQILNNVVGGTASADGLLNASANNSGTVLTAAIQGSGATALVAGNVITNVGNTSSANTSSTNVNVVYGVSAVNTTGLLARNNRISNVYSTSTANSFGGVLEGVHGMVLRGTATNTTFLNNQIALVGSGTAGIAVTGLSNAVNSAAGIGNAFYYNSVYLSGTTGAGVKTFALRHQTTVATAGLLRVRNNVLVNARTGGTGNFAIGVASSLATAAATATVGTTSAASVDTDYNDLFVVDNATRVGENGTAAFAFGTVTPAAGWRGQTGNPDANSRNVNVKFINAATGNLNLDATTNCALDGAGVALSGIDGEYDNATTSRQTTPDLGSDEFSSVPQAAALASSTAQVVCPGSSGTLTLSLAGNGGPFTVVYTDGTTPTMVNNATSGQTIAVPLVGISTTYTLVSATDAYGCALNLTPGSSSLTLNEATTTTWAGTASADWFAAANWTNCVPTSTMDALVPAGLTTYPALTTTATAAVRTLTIASGASLTQSAGTLNVYGNLSNSGTTTLTGGTVALLGSSPLLTGLNAFYGLNVNLASGVVLLNNPASVSSTLTMTQGLLNTNGYALTLPSGATLVETDASYVLGTVSVPDRSLTAGSAESFSGIGLVLTPAVGSVSPGLTPVVRTTGTALTGAGTSVSIKRYFDIQPAVNTGLNVTMDLTFLNHELNGIPSAGLALFKSVTTTAGPWANQSPISVAGNTVTKAGIADFSLWTLGNSANPLPVELTAFTASRTSTDAALAWTTASEKNSRGFEVQVSTDGRSYRVLGFVASPTGASTAVREYSYRDREAGKAGLRYYRLHQLDLDGTATFSPIRTLRFEGEATVLSLSAAPNPFRERLTLAIMRPAGLVGTAAQLRLTDAAGRTLSLQHLEALPAGPSEATLPEAAKLSSGVYFVELAVPGQPSQHLKVVKE